MLEIRILNAIQQLQNPAGDFLMSCLSRLGDAGMIWILFTAVLLLIPKTRRLGLMVGISLCLDAVLCNMILKPWIARIRPYAFRPELTLLISEPHDFSFPSGHTAASFAVVSALLYAGEKRLWKPTLVLAVGIACSRMYFFVHYPTDILGGMLLGCLCGDAGTWIGTQLEHVRKDKKKVI